MKWFHFVDFRTSSFNDIRKNFKMLGGTVSKRKVVQSRLMCSMFCKGSPNCRSYNYCTHGVSFLCELNSDEALMPHTQVIPHPQCTYVGMDQHSVPECKEGEKVQNITDDESPGNCRINEKRVDPFWSSWNVEIIDLNHEWRRYKWRECIEGSHQNRTDCEGDVIVNEEWLIWNTSRTDVRQAMKNCKQLGGQLFGDFDGSSNQSWFLAEKMNFSDFWVGVNDVEENEHWKNLAGKSVPIPWAWSYVAWYRDFAGFFPKYLSENSSRAVEAVINSMEPLGYVCQMIYSEWGPWISTEEFRNETSWKATFNRSCHVSQHGGLGDCEGRTVKTDWISMVFLSKTFEEAKMHCKDIGGQLFGDLDGSAEQLFMLSNLMNYSEFWLGVHNKDYRNWYNLKGELLNDILRWNQDGVGDGNYLVADGSLLRGGNDSSAFILRKATATSSYPFPCQMLYTEWGTWEAQLSDTDTSYRLYYTRSCFRNSPDVILDCDGGSVYYSVFNYKLFKQPQNFSQAVEQCRKSNAQLFGDIDIDSSTISKLAPRLDYESFWVGITDVEEQGAFRSLRGADVSEDLNWEVDEDFKGNYVFVNVENSTENGYRFKTSSPDQKLAFSCTTYFSEWVFSKNPTTEANFDDWKVYYKQECYRNFGYSCTGPQTTKLTNWVKWVRVEKDFTDAVQHCSSIGGQLFGDLYGTAGQLLFMSDQLNTSSYWLGITRGKQENTWFNMRGQEMSDVMEPFFDQSDQIRSTADLAITAEVVNNSLVLAATPKSNLNVFPCQMIYSELSSWRENSTISETPNETEILQTRTCSHSEVGEPEDCVGVIERTLRFYWVFTELNFSSALQNCQQKSANLLDDDESLGPLEYFSDKLNFTCFWIQMTDFANDLEDFAENSTSTDMQGDNTTLAYAAVVDSQKLTTSSIETEYMFFALTDAKYSSVCYTIQ